MVYGENAIKLLRLIMPYLHHPLRRLRAKLILMLYEGRIDYETFTELYEQTKYELGGTDVKRNNALAAAARATPQTHTHGT
jgi:ribosomal protein L19E